VTSSEHPRARIARTLRDASHLFVGSEFEDSTLEEAADLAEQLRNLLESKRTGDHARNFEDFSSGAVDTLREDYLAAGGSPFGHFLASPVTGDHSPFSYDAEQDLDNGMAVTRVTLRRGFEGAPERGHGGIVAALFDESLGMVPPLTGTLAFTGWLRVHYKNPCPLEEPLEFRSWHEGTDGRKIKAASEAKSLSTDVVFATAEALFIAPR